jgi:peptidyl-prolyl cis-trans isomerase C
MSMPAPGQIELEMELLEAPPVDVDVAVPERHIWPGSRSTASSWVQKLLREPLAHFLFAGAVILALSSLFGHSQLTRASDKRIVVSAAEIGRLREIWTRQWGHPPDAAQLDNLVNDYVREEIYYREALASGLDKDDTIIRRRLVEKMEFLSQELVSGEPSNAELRRFFENNRQKYSLPAQVGFTHIYFSTSRRGAVALEDARAALARLTSNRLSSAEAAKLAATLGDSFMLQMEYPPQTGDQIKNLFGDGFANAVLNLEPGKWAGPIRSTYGWHLVRVTERAASRQPALDEVRNQVAIDYKNQRLQTASENYYAGLRQRYQVEIDRAALAAAKAKASQPSAVQPPGQPADSGTPGDLD